MSRALVGAVEGGRHMPAADSAIRLARSLSTSVERLFEDGGTPVAKVAPVLGGRLRDGAMVRAARVGETVVASVLDPTSALGALGASADGVAMHGQVRFFARAEPRGAVIAGCDPLLGIAEGLLERAGEGRLVGVSATSGQALAALVAGRCHAALVHGPARSLKPPSGLRRWHVARWRSGVATHPGLARPSLEALVSDELPFVQREATAACQQAVDRAVRRLGASRRRPRRTAAGHLDAARSALALEGAAVAIEPVALATGLDFLELEVHDVELWVDDRWATLPGVEGLLDLLHAADFRDRAGALPAYDLTDTGAAR